MISKRQKKKENKMQPNKTDIVEVGKVWKTIPVEISASEFFINPIKINMVIDEGACTSLLDAKLANQIGLNGKSVCLVGSV